MRVVLTRLGNFAAFDTDQAVVDAEGNLPLTLLLDEITASSDRAVHVGGKQSLLTDFQFKLWEIFTGGSDAAISAPTSAGKSFVLQNYLNSRFIEATELSVVYIVPTRALILQVSEDLEAAVRELGSALVLYRTTGVLNLAYGALGAMAALISWELLQQGTSKWPAYAAGVGAAAAASLVYGGLLGPYLAEREAVVKATASLGFALAILGVLNWYWTDDTRTLVAADRHVGLRRR